MRILYDTNVLVTILSRREAILDLKRLLAQEGVVHVTSQHILSEVEAVLVERMSLTRQKAKASARLLARISQTVKPGIIEKVCRDPFDDYVLAAAMVGRVDYLVTSDKDLLVLNPYKFVNIITPAHFQKIL